MYSSKSSAGCDTKSTFYAEFNSFEFTVLLDWRHIKAKESSLPYDFAKVRFLPSQSILVLCEMQTASSRTCIAVSIVYGYIH